MWIKGEVKNQAWGDVPFSFGTTPRREHAQAPPRRTSHPPPTRIMARSQPNPRESDQVPRLLCLGVKQCNGNAARRTIDASVGACAEASREDDDSLGPEPVPAPMTRIGSGSSVGIQSREDGTPPQSPERHGSDPPFDHTSGWPRDYPSGPTASTTNTPETRASLAAKVDAPHRPVRHGESFVKLEAEIGILARDGAPIWTTLRMFCRA